MGIEDFQFKKGMEKVPGSGRKVGTRNKLSEAFLRDLHSEWERSGPTALKVLAVENPEALAKLAAGLLPKQQEIEMPSLIVVSTGVPRNEDSIVPAKPRAPLLTHDELLRLSNPTPKDDSENA
jgi:hypothetical protein